MSLIEKGSDDLRYDPEVTTILRQLLAGKCVFFLGAGASIDDTQPSLPTARDLSIKLASKCLLGWHDYIPLSTVAFSYESYFPRDGLNDFPCKSLRPGFEGGAG